MLSAVEFETIYNGNKNSVYNLCLQYLLNTEDARDTTQEVFVKVYQHYHQYNPATASLKTWICRIAINQCLDLLKARRSKKRFGFVQSLFHPGKEESIPDIKTFDHPGIIAEDKEALQHLLLIIQSLPQNQQTAIILSKIENRPQKEVAEIMCISLKAVESLLQRAKQALQKKLEETEGF